MEQQYLDKGAEHPVLGPHYFAARDVVDKFMAQFEPEPFEPIIKKAADELYMSLHERLEQFLLSDVEQNLHGTIWRQIDASVEALMSGERWALERYALTKKYGDGEKIREAVAKHIPAELQEGRVADLEKEVARLKDSLKYYQMR